MGIFRVILAPTVELARNVNADVSVEAEYGATVIEGSIITLAHHQKEGEYSQKGGAPAPCDSHDIIHAHAAALRARLAMKGELVILVSHLDLDTLGGIAHLQSEVSDMGQDTPIVASNFWRLVAFVDVNGPHKTSLSAHATPENVRVLNACHAALRGKTRIPQNEISDVTVIVDQAIALINEALCGNENLLSDGDMLADENERQARSSLVEERASGVVVRCYNGFVNHLYGPNGRAVVAFSTGTGAVTVSLADPVLGVSCRELMQDLFGPDAGGHDGIAGSPRGARMTMAQWWDAVEAMELALDGVRGVTL